MAPSTPGDHTPNSKKKKTKLEKIAELESQVKLLKEENARLQKQFRNSTTTSTSSGFETDFFGSPTATTTPTTTSSPSKSDERLRDALRALKRVTVKQEMSLTNLRQKSKQRRAELDHKDAIIDKLQQDLKAMKKVHEKLRNSGFDGNNSSNNKKSEDVASLKARVVDLELQLAKEQAGNHAQSKQLMATKEDVTSLRTQLDQMKGRVPRVPSSKSLKSTDSSSLASSGEDVARLKREIAKKAEKIANLEHDLEDAQETIQNLKRRKQFDESFPMTPAPGSDDFFSDHDEEEEDDFWS